MATKMTFSQGFFFLIGFFASGVFSDPSRRLNPTRPKAFDYAADAERVVGELHHNFSCDGREYGYYADQGQQCQVFHICMPVKTVTGRILDTFQFSFFCPNQTRFSQDSRTCINEAQAYPCHKAHTLYDLNKAIGHRPNKRKRPINPKDNIRGNFKSNIQRTQDSSRASSASDSHEASTLKESFDDSSFDLKNIDETSVGISVQEGETPVHTDSALAIGAPAVTVPHSAGNSRTTTDFAGHFQLSLTDAPPIGESVSNELSGNLEAPELTIPPGSQIIATKSLQHQNALIKPAKINNQITQSHGRTGSTINVSAHGSSGFSDNGASTQAPLSPSSSFSTTGKFSGTTPIVHTTQSTTPHIIEDSVLSKVNSASHGSSRNNRLNSITVTNRGTGFTTSESPASFKPILQRNRASLPIGGRSGHLVNNSRQQDSSTFSNSHTLEAASIGNTGTTTSLNGRGQISTFASRARAHSAQNILHHHSSLSSGQQGSQSFSFSQELGNDREITSQTITTPHQSISSTPRPFITTTNPVPSLSQQFTPPPITHTTVGTSKPLQIPGFSTGVKHINSGQKQNDDISNEKLSTLSSFPSTTEYFVDGEDFLTTVLTESPFESSKSDVGNNNIQPLTGRNVGSASNRGPARKVTIQRRPIANSHIAQVSSRVNNVNNANIENSNSFTNINRATKTFDQNEHRDHTTVSFKVGSNQRSVTPSSFTNTVTSQRPTTPTLSTSVTQKDPHVNGNREQSEIHQQNKELGNQRDSHKDYIQTTSSIGLTTSQPLTTRNIGNRFSPSRGLRNQITTGNEKSSAAIQTSATVGVNRGPIVRIQSHPNDVSRVNSNIDQSPHTDLTSISSSFDIGSNQNSATPAKFTDSVSGQRATTTDSSLSNSQQEPHENINGKHIEINSHIRQHESHGVSHNNNTKTTEFHQSSLRESTSAQSSFSRTRGNNLTSSRGLRNQITTSTGNDRSGVDISVSDSSAVNRSPVIRTHSHSGDTTEVKTTVNNGVIDRGSSQGISNPQIRNTTPRPVNRNRGTKKFQPSQYLLQSSGFHNSQWQPQPNQNIHTRNNVSRSRSRSRSASTSSSIQASSTNQNGNGNGFPSTATTEASIKSTTAKGRDSSLENSHEIVDDAELAKHKHNFAIEHIRSTTIRPVTQASIQSTSRGRAFLSRGLANDLKSSQQIRSEHNDHGASSAIRTDPSSTIQHGNSRRITHSHSVSSRVTTPRSRQVLTTSSVTATNFAKQPVTNSPIVSRQEFSSNSFSRSNSQATALNLNENLENSGNRKVIKKKIIVNGRPGSRKTHESTESVPIAETKQEINPDEEEKIRQRALDALAKFNPGFANANILSIRIIPNGAKKNKVPQGSTTEASTQISSVPKNSLISQRRTSNRALSTTTAKPTTISQTSNFRSRSNSRRISRPTTQKSLLASTTAKPIATNASFFHRLKSTKENSNFDHQISISKNSTLSHTLDGASISSQSTKTSTRNRGNTKFSSSVSSSRGRILKKVTPLISNQGNSRNIHSSVTSSESTSKLSSASQTSSGSLAKQVSQQPTNYGKTTDKPSGQLRVVGTSIESSVSSNLESGKSKIHTSSSSSSSPSARSRSNSRSRSSPSFSSQNRGNLITKQEGSHEPLTDLELEALSAIAQVNSAFSNAAKTRVTSTASFSRRRNTSRSRSL